MENLLKDKNVPLPVTPRSYFWRVTKPHKWWMFAAIFVAVTAAAVDQGMSLLYKLIVDAVEAGESNRLIWLGLSFPVLIFMSQILFRLSSFFGMKLSTGAQKTGTDYLFSYVTNHSHTYFSNRFAGAIQNKIKNVVGGVNDLIPEILWSYLYTLTSLIVTFGFIISVDLTAAGLFFILVIILIILNTKLSPRKRELSKQQAAASTLIQGNIIDILSNVGVARLYTKLNAERSLVATLTQKFRLIREKSWMATELMLFINSVVLLLFGLLMFGFLIYRWQLGEITTGEFVLVASLVSQLSGTLMFIGKAFNSTAQTIGEMREGLETIFLPYDLIDSEGATELQVTDGGSITLDNVSFLFESNPTAVFKDFSLTIPAGQRVGLVGASGAGKSTFVSLLLRQHDVTNGAILIDGQNIASVTQDSLRANIAVVPQEPMLFHRTIRENIAYGKEGASQSEIEAVAKKAYAHDFIMSLPLGYDTLVGERGVKLSGGQKQRVAIARAMLKDAPILILDEATSALDSESEVEIQKALHMLMNGKTVIAVAHRLSTLREMDRIIVLHDGHIIEDGTHESLKQASGTYANLWTHQAGGFITE